MAGQTSPFANPSPSDLEVERSKDLIIGDARIPYCRIRKGWAMIGGKITKDSNTALGHADLINNNAKLWREKC